MTVDIGPEFGQGHAGKARDSRDMLGGNSGRLPRLDRAAAKTKMPAEGRTSAGFLDGVPRDGGEVRGSHDPDSTTKLYLGTTGFYDRVQSNRTVTSVVMDYPLLSQSDHQKVVGARLRRLIGALGLRLTEAATVMGTSKQMLNHWLSGNGYPNEYAVYRLCRVHRVTYDYLFLGDWSQLPAALATKLAPDLSRRMESAEASDRSGGGSTA